MKYLSFLFELLVTMCWR